MFLSLFKAREAEIFPIRGQWRPEQSPGKIGLCSPWLLLPPAQGHCPTFRLAQGGSAQFCFASLGCYATCGYPTRDRVRVLSKQKANWWMMNKLSTKNAEKKMTRTSYRQSIWTPANIHPSVTTDNSGLRNLQRKLPSLFQANHLQSLSTTIHWRIKSTAASQIILSCNIFSLLIPEVAPEAATTTDFFQIPLQTSAFFLHQTLGHTWL